MQLYHAIVDISGDYSVDQFSSELVKFKMKVIDWVANGPGGGNPMVTLEFTSREDAMVFLKDHYPQDDERWIASHLKEVAA